MVAAGLGLCGRTVDGFARIKQWPVDQGIKRPQWSWTVSVMVANRWLRLDLCVKPCVIALSRLHRCSLHQAVRRSVLEAVVHHCITDRGWSLPCITVSHLSRLVGFEWNGEESESGEV